MDPPAGLYSSQNTIDQPGDTKLRSHESFDRCNLADVHPEDSGPVRQSGDEIQRIIPAESAWFGRSQGRNERSGEPVTIEGQIHWSAAGLDDIGNPASGSPFVGARRIQQLSGKKCRNLISARDTSHLFRTNRSNPDLHERQPVV